MSNSITARKTRRSMATTGLQQSASRGHSIMMILPAVLSTLFLQLPTTKAALPCQTTQDCIDALRPGSECVDNQCTNPYYAGGCLKQRLDGWKKTRVCHSEDPPEAVAKGHCIPPDPNFNYPEIRVAAQNWESAFFQAWIIQIVLTEILGIPVTLETGTAEDEVDFYHPDSRMDYGISYDYEALRRGNDVGDCRLLNNTNKKGEEYQSCAHVLPEVWQGQDYQWMPLLEDGVIRRPGLIGTLGYQGLYLPRFTAANDTSLLTYLGLAGEQNRRKLAETFLRPTTWKDYCEYVSDNNCTKNDDPTANGYPGPGDQDRYHVEGSYQGHFRATEKNDCDLYPNSCTGHFVDYPCGWTSFLQQQTKHLNIALESNGPELVSGGYSYSQMTEIWAAANATKSNVMMRWWTPEALFQTFLGTDSEFTRVDLPPPTQECAKARILPADRCRADLPESVRFGDPKGNCDEPPFALQRLFTKSLVDYSNDPNLPKEVRSPGYQTIDNIQLDGLQLGEIFEYWLKRNSDRYNFDPRDASCRWVAENFVTVQSMLPPTYPRIIQDEEITNDALDVIAVIFACTAAICVGCSAVGVVMNRKKPAIVLAQVNFLYLLLVGLAMVTMASILQNVPPSDGTCMATAWLVSLGYTFELVPLLFKVAAIASLISASRKFKRVRLDKRKLFSAVFVVGIVIVIFLILWTCLDPVEKRAEFRLTYETNEEGDTIVSRSYYCSSDSDAWLFISLGWQAFLLFCGTILAITTRNMRKDMTESLVVSVLVYSHLMFVVLRMLQFHFRDRLDAWNLARYTSLILSGDVIAACCIYFFPKLLFEEDKVTRNPIVPPVFMPPESVRHVFAQVSNQVTRRLPRIESGIHHLADSNGDDDDDDSWNGPAPVTRGFDDGERSLTRNLSMPTILEQRSDDEGPKDIMRDSLSLNDAKSRSLRFDSLMTSSGHQRPVDILSHSFDFETLQLNSRRSSRSLGSNPPTLSALTLDTACTTIHEEGASDLDMDSGHDRRASLSEYSHQAMSLPSGLVGRTREEEEGEDWDRFTSVSC